MTKLSEWVDTHQEDCIGFLQKIIQIPSVTGDEAAVQEYIAGYTKELGLDTTLYIPSLEDLRKHPAFVEPQQDYENRPNVVAILKGDGTGKSLLFNGHIDVIPEGAPENWEHGPWSGDVEDGKLYGRGASDMKSGAAAFTMAMKAVIDSGVKLKGDVILEYVMDEELTGNGTLDCVMKGYKADAGICCETSSMCIQPGSIGRIWFEIRAKGKAVGIQRRYEGVNGIDLGYLIKEAVEEYEKLRLKTVSCPSLYPIIEDAIPCMIGQFESGTYASAFPDAVLMKGSMATVPGEDSDEVKAEFIRFVREYTGSRNAWLKENPPEIIYTGYFAEPSSIPEDAPIVSLLKDVFEDIMEKKPVISGRQGAADIRHLNKYGNTQTVIFGPGMTEQMHANNEWVYVEDYLNSIKILADTIVKWCGVVE